MGVPMGGGRQSGTTAADPRRTRLRAEGQRPVQDIEIVNFTFPRWLRKRLSERGQTVRDGLMHALPGPSMRWAGTPVRFHPVDEPMIGVDRRGVSCWEGSRIPDLARLPITEEQ
jgi:hypothetical protein